MLHSNTSTNAPRKRTIALVSDSLISETCCTNYSRNTIYSQESIRKTFNDFILQNSPDLTMTDLSNSDLDKLLQQFYLGLRTFDGHEYKCSSLLTMRQHCAELF